jgi:hypothetical protein
MRTRQTAPGVDVSSLFTLVWLIFYFVVFYLFYSILKRIELTLAEIKKQLDAKPSTAT